MSDPGPAARDDAAYRERRLAVVATLFSLAWLAAAAVQFADATMDDAFISLRYVRHLVERGSLAFNPGAAPVEGVTNLGWVLLLAPFALAMPAPLAAKAVGAAATFAAVALAARLGWRAAGDGAGRWAVAAGAALGLAASFDFSFFALAGMETGALAALLLALAAFAERGGARTAIALGLGAAAAFLIRPEAALALPIYLALRWRRADPAERATLRRALLAFAAGVAAIELARLAWFGALLPNTAHAKPSFPALWLFNAWGLIAGRTDLTPAPVAGLLPLAAMAFGWATLRRGPTPRAADMLAAIAGTGLVFALYAATDWTRTARYFAPYLPAALILFWAGVAAAVRALPRFRPLVLSALLLGALLVAAVDSAIQRARADAFPGYVLFGRDLVAPSRWMAAALPPGAVVATRRIGAIGYFSSLDVFDYANGLTEPAVARGFAGLRRHFTDPNDPGLAAIWRQRRPTHLLEDVDVMAQIAAAAGGTPAGFVVQGDTFRVVRAFKLGAEGEWLLAARVDQPPLPP